MSRYATSRVLYDITRDRELAEAFRVDPELVLADRELADDERRAVAEADMRSLFEFGIHPFVIYHFALRLAGGFSLPFMQSYLAQLEGLTIGSLET